MTWDVGIDRDSPAYSFAISNSRTIRSVAGLGTGKAFGLKRRVARLLEEGMLIAIVGASIILELFRYEYAERLNKITVNSYQMGVIYAS